MEGEEELLKDARRLLAVNAGEQKRLEKLQRHIDKKRREKERMLTRAQEDAVVKFYETSGKGLNEFLFIEKSYKGQGNRMMKAVTSSDLVQGHEIISNENTTVKEAKQKRKQNHQKLSLQEKSSKSFLPGLELTVYGLRAYPFQRGRSRSWSSLTESALLESKNDDKEGKNIVENKEEHGEEFSSFQKESVETTEKIPEKPLSAILPPLVLPPLHKHRRPSLQEHTKNYYRTGETFTLDHTKSLKEHYKDLSDCRYLRIYQPKKRF